MFGLGDWILEEHRRHWLAGIEASWVKRTRFDRKCMLIALGSIPPQILLCLFLAHDAIHHQVTLATVSLVVSNLTFIALAGALSYMDFPLEWMVQSLPNVGALERDLAAQNDVVGGELPAAGLPAHEIRFRAVRFAYPQSATNVLDGLDLQLHAGSSTAIVGVNGAGKTTLIKLLCGLHQPTSGSITVDGIDLKQLNAAQWQRQVAVVFQDFTHYPTTARENVAFGAVAYSDDVLGVEKVTSRVGATGVIDALPHGWDTILSREFAGGTDLSGGQWQRLALARALFAARHGARVLVLDEPTAWLDVRGESEFFAKFLDITAGLTTIVISHRFSTVRRADNICVLDGGRVTERGSHEQLLRAGGVYAEMFSVQAARFAGPAEAGGLA